MADFSTSLSFSASLELSARVDVSPRQCSINIHLKLLKPRVCASQQGVKENVLQWRLDVQAPKKETKDLFLQYAALEEQYGLDRSAMAVYDQAARTVPVDQRLQIYNVYLAKAREMYGAKGIQKVSHSSRSLQAFKSDSRGWQSKCGLFDARNTVRCNNSHWQISIRPYCLSLICHALHKSLWKMRCCPLLYVIRTKSCPHATSKE